MAVCRVSQFPSWSSSRILVSTNTNTNTNTNTINPFFSPKYPSQFPNFSPPHRPLSSLLFRSSHFSPPSASMETPPQGYRRNVGICLINEDKKIFAASRLDIPTAWQMPQGLEDEDIGRTVEALSQFSSGLRCISVGGGIDEGEDPRNAAIRELREETGVKSAEVVFEAPNWLTYDFPPDVRKKLKVQWGSDWKGQAQKWFLMKFNGQDEEINLLGDGTEKAEFGEWSWMSPEEVIEKAVDFKQPVYREVIAVFAPFLQK